MFQWVWARPHQHWANISKLESMNAHENSITIFLCIGGEDMMEPAMLDCQILFQRFPNAFLEGRVFFLVLDGGLILDHHVAGQFNKHF